MISVCLFSPLIILLNILLKHVFNSDVERIREGIGSKFSIVTQYLATFVSGIVVGVIVNWRLTSFLLLVGPLLIAASAYMAKVSFTEMKFYSIYFKLTTIVLMDWVYRFTPVSYTHLDVYKRQHLALQY